MATEPVPYWGPNSRERTKGSIDLMKARKRTRLAAHAVLQPMCEKRVCPFWKPVVQQMES